MVLERFKTTWARRPLVICLVVAAVSLFYNGLVFLITQVSHLDLLTVVGSIVFSLSLGLATSLWLATRSQQTPEPSSDDRKPMKRVWQAMLGGLICMFVAYFASQALKPSVDPFQDFMSVRIRMVRQFGAMPIDFAEIFQPVIAGLLIGVAVGCYLGVLTGNKRSVIIGICGGLLVGFVYSLVMQAYFRSSQEHAMQLLSEAQRLLRNEGQWDLDMIVKYYSFKNQTKEFLFASLLFVPLGVMSGLLQGRWRNAWQGLAQGLIAAGTSFLVLLLAGVIIGVSYPHVYADGDRIHIGIYQGIISSKTSASVRTIFWYLAGWLFFTVGLFSLPIRSSFWQMRRGSATQQEDRGVG